CHRGRAPPARRYMALAHRRPVYGRQAHEILKKKRESTRASHPIYRCEKPYDAVSHVSRCPGRSCNSWYSGILRRSGGYMLTSGWRVALKSKPVPVILMAVGLAACSSPTPDQPLAVKADKPFVAAGSIEMQLDAGSYIVRAAPDEHIRVSIGGNTGNATAELATNGAHANLTVRDAPHNNFRAT